MISHMCQFISDPDFSGKRAGPPEVQGVSKKTEFYRIEHLLIGFHPWYRQYVSIYKLFFVRFLLRLSKSMHSQVMQIGKLGPTASNFGYDF